MSEIKSENRLSMGTSISVYTASYALKTLLTGSRWSCRTKHGDASHLPELLLIECKKKLFRTLAGTPSAIRAGLITQKGHRVAGTCEWIKGNETFAEWLRPGSQLLWLSGGPGTGKTIFSIYLTQELEKFVQQSRNTAVLYFFCNNTETGKTAPAILRGLVYQLLEQIPASLQYLLPQFEIRDKALFRDDSFEELWTVFESMVGGSTTETVYCVLDGLDGPR
jgi:Cdc6-like AAA superfamily ATPase